MVAQTAAPEAVSRLAIHKITLTIECPAETFAANFTGTLEPRIVNGLANGLSPSHVLFEGKGGKTTTYCALPWVLVPAAA